MNDEIKEIFIRQMLLPKEELAMQTMELLADKMDLQQRIDKALDHIEKYCIDDEFYVNLTNKEKNIIVVKNILNRKDDL